MYTDELMHYGKKGMKWGQRLYQNKDGTLTPLGKKRYGTAANFNKVQRAEAKAKNDAEKAKAKARTEAEIAKIRKKYKIDQNGKSDTATESTKPKTKSMSEMSDDEIRSKINRIQLENQLKSLQPKQVKKGEKFVNAISDVVVPAAKNAGKDALEKYLKKSLSKALGVDEKTTEEVSKQLAKEAQDLKNRVSIETSKRTLNKYAREAREQSERLRNEREANENADNDSSNSGGSNSSSSSSNNNSGGSERRNNDSDSGNYRTSVHGEGRSSRNSDESHRQNDDSIDIDFTELVENPPAIVNDGENYIRNRFFR